MDTFKHKYEDCVIGSASSLYVPARSKPFDLSCLFALPFGAEDAETNANERDALQSKMEHYLARLRSHKARRREGNAFYASLLRGVPHYWAAYYERFLRFFQSNYGMFKWRDDVELRRYQRGKKYVAVVEVAGQWLYGEYASRRELEQDIGPVK